MVALRTTGTTRIVIAGASGRMGRALICAVSETAGVSVAAALEAPGHPYLGEDSGALAGLKPNGVKFTADALPALADADAVIDFTTPEVSLMLATLAAQARIVHVIGTTGFTPAQETKLEAAARHAVIIKSGNMSIGINVLAALVKQAARALPGYDIEIVEMHHRMKADAPSGTALMLGRAAAEARGIALDENATRGRDGQTGPRADGTIGFAALRGGTVVGEHQVILAGPRERLVLSHSAEDRSIFAEGAIAAARWGLGRKPGLYAMSDVLSLN